MRDEIVKTYGRRLSWKACARVVRRRMVRTLFFAAAWSFIACLLPTLHSVRRVHQPGCRARDHGAGAGRKSHRAVITRRVISGIRRE